MRVIVEMYGLLRGHVQGDRARLDLDVPEGTTVGDLVAQLGVSKNEPWIASLDGKLVEDSRPLADGCRLVVLPPMEGGQGHAPRSEWRGEV